VKRLPLGNDHQDDDGEDKRQHVQESRWNGGARGLHVQLDGIDAAEQDGTWPARTGSQAEKITMAI
jgi:hypothetical protein